MPIFVGAGNSAFLHNNAVGVGTTTTAGRNAGVGTAMGEVIYNVSTTEMLVYTGVNWSAL